MMSYKERQITAQASDLSPAPFLPSNPTVNDFLHFYKDCLKRNNKKKDVTEIVRSLQSPNYLFSGPLQKKFAMPLESKTQ